MTKISLLKSALLAASLSLLGSSYAQAATTFTGNTSGIFTDPITTSSAVVSGVGTNSFSSGEASPNSTSNILEFTGNSFSTTVGNLFTLGKLDYTNGITTSGTNVDSINLSTTLNLDTPIPLTQNFDFRLAFELTPNLGNDPLEDADQLIAEISVPDQSFTFEEQELTLELIGFSQDGGATINNTFFALEEAETSGFLFARITQALNSPATDVPEPMSVLGLGAFATMALARRKRSARKA